MVQKTVPPGTVLDLPEPQTFPTVELYELDDKDGRPVWVGVGKDAQRRERAHWYRRHDPVVRRQNPALCDWLNTLDGPPAVRVICTVPYEMRHVVEGAAILAYRSAGYPLLNRRVGQRWMPEDRARIAAGMRRYRAQQRALTSV